MESQQQKQLEQMKNNVKGLLIQLKNAGTKYQLLEQIIVLNLNEKNKSESFKNIQTSILNSLNTNPALFFDYMQFPKIFEISELVINGPEYKKVLEVVNTIKIKYGTTLNNILMASRDPFLINGIETSIAHGESAHTIRISRGDGESLEGVFRPKNLLPLITALTSSLKLAMENGIYNLDQQTIDQYLTESEGFKAYLKELLNGAKNE